MNLHFYFTYAFQKEKKKRVRSEIFLFFVSHYMYSGSVIDNVYKIQELKNKIK